MGPESWVSGKTWPSVFKALSLIPSSSKAKTCNKRKLVDTFKFCQAWRCTPLILVVQKSRQEVAKVNSIFCYTLSWSTAPVTGLKKKAAGRAHRLSACSTILAIWDSAWWKVLQPSWVLSCSCAPVCQAHHAHALIRTHVVIKFKSSCTTVCTHMSCTHIHTHSHN